MISRQYCVKWYGLQTDSWFSTHRDTNNRHVETCKINDKQKTTWDINIPSSTCDINQIASDRYKQYNSNITQRYMCHNYHSTRHMTQIQLTSRYYRHHKSNITQRYISHNYHSSLHVAEIQLTSRHIETSKFEYNLTLHVSRLTLNATFDTNPTDMATCTINTIQITHHET